MKKSNIKNTLIQNNTYLIFIALVIACALLSDTFLTAMNIRNIGLQQSGPVCVVLGMLFVILTGGIDLSVGSVMALGACASAYMIVNWQLHFVPAMLITLVIGIACGAFVGCLVAYANFQGFVASLTMMTMARGLALMITRGAPIRMDKATLGTLVNKEYFYPMLFIVLICILVFMFVQKYTAFGRIVIAIGSNIKSVELAGIHVRRYLVAVYAISGFMAALAGTFIAARSSTGAATVGNGQELDAIAACVIGGASLAGGKGDVLKAVIGALVLALISNIMNLCAVPAYPQDVIKGIIIIIAVLLQIATAKADTTV